MERKFKNYFLLLPILFIAEFATAQAPAYNRSVVDTLTSDYFWGRGYTRDGMSKAATYIQNQFSAIGLQPMNRDNYLQPFSYPVNTFPGDMKVEVNGKELVPGKDFIVGEESPGSKAKGKLTQADSVTFIDRSNAVILQLENKLTWSVSTSAADYTLIKVLRSAVSGEPSTYKVKIDNKFIEKFEASNVAAMVKGTMQPDSMIIFTAHYDHLGGMGKDTYFPGANDNASGVALLLSLAKYFAAHPQPYSIGFICFAGEEAGILGSKYFTEHPLVNLKKIRFLINTDLAGTGVDGITVVNATEFPKEFALMQEINKKGNYLSAINARGKAANSDHYFFTEKGVPSFFFYTLGGIAAYHDINDVAATLPLDEQEDLQKLLIEFCQKLTGK